MGIVPETLAEQCAMGCNEQVMNGIFYFYW